MKLHFVTDGLSNEQANTLRSIESVLTGRSTTAVFELKALDVFTNRDPEKAKSFVSGRLGAFHMDALEVLLERTGLDLIGFYNAVKGVPVALTARR